jgi:dedicated sortase system histidine kinase
MNLKRQLLLVSLLTLVLPWAGYKFIRETESALRTGQQQMLAGTARAIADSLAQYPEEFPPAGNSDHVPGDQVYGHRLATRPEIDGYFNDWALDRESLRTLRGVDGPILFALGLLDDSVYLYVEVSDHNVVYAGPGTAAVEGGPRYSDRVSLVSMSPPYLEEVLTFAAEAPGPIITYVRTSYGFGPEPAIRAYWQDVPRGYLLEARIPVSELGTHLGLVVGNTSSELEAPVRSASYASKMPGPFVRSSPELTAIAGTLGQRDTRLLITDAAGWRIAESGSLTATGDSRDGGAAWLRLAYNALIENGEQAELAEPDPRGREQQAYIASALAGKPSVSWFRSPQSGRAVVAAAEPVRADGTTIGAVVLQQGTDAILSLRNEGLSRLITVTLIATILVAISLLGYASWLSRRIRRLSIAAEGALESRNLRASLPSAAAGDEIGDLSRSFAGVLRQLGDYNDYLRSLASKLSHELRTPLAIVTSSLENLEHEALSEEARGYSKRARDGADRLRRILTAMSEASRVEELMQHADPERFDLAAAVEAAVAAYRDVFPGRRFDISTGGTPAIAQGSPELVIQMLDKLVNNAVDFSADGATVSVNLERDRDSLRLAVHNPGPALPERMRSRLFDSMVSVRPGDAGKHLGLGLYVARLIAEGHGGSITAENAADGVTVTVSLPSSGGGDAVSAASPPGARQTPRE